MSSNRTYDMDNDVADCKRRADKYFKDGNLQMALLAYQKEIKLNKTLSSDNIADKTDCYLNIALSTRQLSEIYLQWGQYDEAIMHGGEYLKLSKEINNEVEIQRAYTTMGRVYFEFAVSLPKSTKQAVALKKALASHQKSSSLINGLDVNRREMNEMEAVAFLNIGLVFELQGNYEEAISHIKKAMEICKQSNLDTLLRCYFGLGVLYENQSNFNSALNYFSLAIEFGKKIGSTDIGSSHIEKAKIYLQMEDFVKAIVESENAYKLETSKEQKLIPLGFLKFAKKLYKIQKELLKVPNHDYATAKRLFERKGDILSKMGLFSTAIVAYQNMLKNAETAGETGKELIPIFVSLSQTYNDNNDYENAINFFKRELAILDDGSAKNFEDVSRTFINLGEAMVSSSVQYHYNDIEMNFMNARTYADKAGKINLVALALNHLKDLQLDFKFKGLAEETQKQLDLIQKEESLSQLEDTPDPASETSSSEESDESLEKEEFDRPTRKRGTSLKVTRNDKGETPLHSACISGNLQRVKTLISQAHPVNIRDYAGWTPLHEACNHDNLNIVDFLLDNGANIDDPGLPRFEGVTPLLDAANNGNLAVVELLIDRGANVLSKTDHGDTVLDCLISWYRRANQSQLSQTFINHFQQIEDKLRKSFLKAGISVSDLPSKSNDLSIGSRSEVITPNPLRVNRSTCEPKSDHKTISKSQDKAKSLEPLCTSKFLKEVNKLTKPRRRRTFTESEGEGEYRAISPDLLGPLHRSQLDDKLQHRDYRPGTGDSVNNYLEVMKNVRHKRNDLAILSPIKETKKVSAFLDQEEVGDNWLDDDLPIIKRRKMAASCNEFLIDNGNNPSSHRSTAATSRLSHGNKVQKCLPNSTSALNYSDFQQNISNISSTLTSRHDSPQPTRSIDLSESPPQYQTKKRPVQSTLKNAGFSRLRRLSPIKSRSNYQQIPLTQRSAGQAVKLVQPPPVTVPCTANLSLKVRIKDTLLMVPVLPNQTISHLAKQAAKRYFSRYGVLPSLSLSTKDGALLADEDSVSMIIDSEEIQTEVLSWNKPLLLDRYEDACSFLGKDVDDRVKDLIASCDGTLALDLSNQALTSDQLAPVFRALHEQDKIVVIDVSGNLLKDEGMRILADCLSRMIHLEQLNIANNFITYVGLRHILNLFSSSEAKQPLQHLSSLNLSHNILAGDPRLKNLIGILEATSLKTLNLQCCNLTSTCFDYPENRLLPLFCLDSVENLNISFNRLGSKGVAEFLGCLNTERLAHLNMAGTVIAKSKSSTVAKELLLFLERQLPVSLISLNLSEMHLVDQDVTCLLRHLCQSNSFESLILSNNPELSSVTLKALLINNQEPSFQYSDLTGCHNICKGLEEKTLIDWFNDIHIGSLLNGLALTISDQGSFDDVVKTWTEMWGERAIIRRGPFDYLQLNVK